MHPHHNHHIHCEPLEPRIAPAALSVSVLGHGEELGAISAAHVAQIAQVAQGFITFTVSLDAPQASPVSVDYFTSDGTAIGGSDYVHTAGSLVFEPGETSKTLTVPVLDDTTVENDETFSLNLSQPKGVALANASAVAAIWDNDTLVDFAGQEINEGDETASSALFTFVLASPLAHPVSFSFSTLGITATAGQDYLAADGVVTFQPGETAKVVPVSILGDKLDEYTEELSLTLGSVSGARFGNGLPMRILDDDAKPGVSISDTVILEGESGVAMAAVVLNLDAPSAKTVTINYSTVGGSAVPGSDYVSAGGAIAFAPGETSKIIAISIIGDTDPEADEQFEVQISSATNAQIKDGNATVTIWSDDSNDPLPVLSIGDATVIEGDTGTVEAEFTVTLSSTGMRTIFVTYNAYSGTAIDTGDFSGKSGVLTFAPGETSKTIRIEVNGDFAVEPDEDFTIGLSSPVNATLGDAEGKCTITNDDVPVPPAIMAGDALILEGTGIAQQVAFTISLTSSSANTVSLSYSTVAGTAVSGVDFIPATGTVTFAPGERTKTVMVTIVGDSVVEQDETFGLVLTAPVNATLGDAEATATIANDDTPHAAPAGFTVTPRLAKWIDADGDAVRVISSLPIFTASMFNFDANGELALLDLATASLSRTTLNFQVKRALDGDGSVNVGAIESPGKDLGSVTVKGSLDRIVAGDAKMSTPGIRALTVETLGYLSGESGPGSLRSDIAGSLAKLVVKKSFNGAAVYVSGVGAGMPSTVIKGDMSATPEATDTGLHADGVIGTVRVTGSVSGADVSHPVQVFAAGPRNYGNAINNVIVLGGMQFAQIVAGHGASPLVTAGWTSIGTVNVAKALLASTISAGLEPGEGGFFGAKHYLPLQSGYGVHARIARVIAGNATTGGVINGTPDEVSTVDQFGIFAREVGTVKVGGKVMSMRKYVQEEYVLGTTGDVMCREF